MDPQARLDDVIHIQGEELVDAYLQSVQLDLTRLLALPDSSTEEVAKILHTLVGTSAVLGFAEVAHLCKGLEQSFSLEISPSFRQRLEPLRELIDQLQTLRRKKLSATSSL